jgi:hypothetical protein
MSTPVVLITGAQTGIGRATLFAFAQTASPNELRRICCKVLAEPWAPQFSEQFSAPRAW